MILVGEAKNLEKNGVLSNSGHKTEPEIMWDLGRDECGCGEGGAAISLRC